MFRTIIATALAEIEHDPGTSRLGSRIVRASRAEIEGKRDDQVVPAVFAEIARAKLEDAGLPPIVAAVLGGRIARAVGLDAPVGEPL